MELNDAGLCGHCRWARIVDTRRAARYWRCGRAEVEPGFDKYPRLPRRVCPGYEPAVTDGRPPRRGPSPLPAVGAAAACAVLALVLSPAVVGRFVSLRWYVGDIRPLLHGAQAAVLVGGASALLARRAIGGFFGRVFGDPAGLARRVAGAVVFVAVVLGVAEVAFRWLGLPFVERWAPTENAVARFDADLGWAYVPGRSVVQPFGQPPRPVPLHFDAEFGARVGAPDDRLDPGRASLLLVGGSVTMGHGVTYPESFAGRLDADPGFSLQVVNLAVQGYGTDQSLVQLRRHRERFPLQAVVYGFICDHVRRNSVEDRRLLLPGARFLGTKPLFALDDAGRPYLRRAPRRYDELGYSRLWAHVRLAWIQNGPIPGLELTRGLVGEMKREAEAVGARFFVLYWYQDESPVTCGQAPFAGLDVTVIDTAQHEPPGWDYWGIPGDGHPDPRAHAHVAGLLRRAFAAEGLGSENAPRRLPLNDGVGRSTAREAGRSSD